MRHLPLAALLLVPLAADAARPTHPRRVASISWNQAITCTPFTATANDIIERRHAPGISDPASTAPPCSAGHTSQFVQMRRMRIIGSLTRVCPDGETLFCDSVFVVEDAVAPGPNRKPQQIRCVINSSWKRAAIAPPDPGRAETQIEIQGFVHHNKALGTWEIHPVTAWR